MKNLIVIFFAVSCLVMFILVALGFGSGGTPPRRPAPPPVTQRAPVVIAPKAPVLIAPKMPEVKAYSVIKKALPKEGHVVVDLLVIQPQVEKEIIDAVTAESQGYNTAVVRVYSTKEAYDEDQKRAYSAIHKAGFIGVFIKKNGAEFRWMQEIGKFKNKFGTVTSLP